MIPNKVYVHLYTKFLNCAETLQLLIIRVLTYATMLSLFQIPYLIDLVGCF